LQDFVECNFCILVFSISCIVCRGLFRSVSAKLTELLRTTKIINNTFPGLCKSDDIILVADRLGQFPIWYERCISVLEDFAIVGLILYVLYKREQII